MRALLIREPWIGKILDGNKTWELRGSTTNVRETIALVASGSGTVVGVCELVDCIGPLSAHVFKENARNAGMEPEHAELGYYKRTYAWVMAKPRRLTKPIPYSHPSGAVIWVKLNDAVEKSIGRNLPRS